MGGELPEDAVSLHSYLPLFSSLEYIFYFNIAIIHSNPCGSFLAFEVHEHHLGPAPVADILDSLEEADLHSRLGLQNLGGLFEHLSSFYVGFGFDDGGLGNPFLDGCGLHVLLGLCLEDEIWIEDSLPLMKMCSMYSP